MKPYIEILRIADTGTQTLGKGKVYHWDKQKQAYKVVFQFVTLELPWKGNENKVSCIPTGNYKLTYLTNSPAFNYPHYQIESVENRTYIKIHRGNFVSQLLGCILPGDSFAFINKDHHLDVTNSTGILSHILKLVGTEGNITIKTLIKETSKVEEIKEEEKVQIPFVFKPVEVEKPPVNHVEKPSKKALV